MFHLLSRWRIATCFFIIRHSLFILIFACLLFSASIMSRRCCVTAHHSFDFWIDSGSIGFWDCHSDAALDSGATYESDKCSPALFCQSIGELRGGGRLTVSSKNNTNANEKDGMWRVRVRSRPIPTRSRDAVACLSYWLLLMSRRFSIPFLHSLSSPLFFLSAFSSFFFIPSSFQLNPTLPFNRIGMSVLPISTIATFF